MTMNNKIKLLFTTLGLSTIGTVAYAQQVSLQGRIPNPESQQQTLTLSQVNGYKAAVELAEDGTFKATFPTLQPGLYHLEKVGELYLAPDYQLQVTVNKNGKNTFKGKGAAENQKLYNSRQSLSRFIPSSPDGPLFKAYAMDIPVFISQLDKYRTFVAKQAAGSRDDFFASTLNNEAALATGLALRSYRIYYGADSVKLANFYRFMDSSDRTAPNATARIDSAYKAAHTRSFTTDERKLVDSLNYEMLRLDDVQSFNQSSAYRNLLDSWISDRVYKSGLLGSKGFENMQLAQIHIANTQLNDPTIGGHYRYQFSSAYLKLIKEDAEADKLYQSFMSDPTNAAYQPKMKAIYDKRMAVRKGKPSPDFNFENIDGGQSKLSDLRGKYVYIDVWATWCGPCKMEIPHLIKLEKELHGKNITFVSLSLDDQKDKQKWKDYVAEKQLGGVQVISDKAFDTDFVQLYNINAIPRFILLDPEGNVVSPNANRPSDPKLKEELLSLLQ
ncbi:thiol-disulfide isomerase/thioredoxin [Sphingobacterium yanglingense]|uniref:Thiol-disulfide isomerase/thioredoxin n=2 Tax=Sphingobacterium yanglingense TaxID=1437280 RepID=A0A4R6WG36_9SPHI|nr:thiol-disulfide isomerase/thioredoxin [Sphingobacterium yanglingense]